MKIKNINTDYSRLIIAEIGNNHEGSIQNAYELIDNAKEAGANAVKFQTFKTENFISKHQKERFNKLKKFELSEENFRDLSVYAKDKGLIFISTPLDIESAEFLSEIVDALKIASGDNNYYDLIKQCASYNLPIIISTGMMEVKELHILCKFLDGLKIDASEISLLHCVSSYPADIKLRNMKSIQYLIENTNFTVGYSDHTVGIDSAIIAASLGARIIEKHFTLDKNFSDFRDHALSADKHEMSHLVNIVSSMDLILGRNDKIINNEERDNIFGSRRSLYARSYINKGELITKKNISFLRPFKKLSPNQVENIIGRRAKKNIEKDELLDPEYFE